MYEDVDSSALFFFCGSVTKNLPANAGDMGSIPGLGRSPGGGHGNPLQYSCLENPLDRGAWRATVHGVAESRTRLSDSTATNVFALLNFLLFFSKTQHCVWEVPPHRPGWKG